MSVPVPLAIRIYNIARAFDYHITRWVEDFSFRHTAPGGCASATLKLHIPADIPLDPQDWGRLFTRVQVVDKRNANVVWEGRVEDPAQRSDEETWELGVLGSSVCATDVTIPYIYVDNTLEHWKSVEADAYEHKQEELTKTLATKLQTNYVFNAGTQFDIWTWIGGSANGTALARVTCTYDATGPNAAQDDFFDQILNGGIYGNLDVTAFNAATITKVNLFPDDAQFPDGLINQIYFSVRRNSSTYTIVSSDNAILRFKNPKVQAIRLDRFGNPLLTSVDYAHGDFVYVRHVVEDVIGRWLVGNWKQGPSLSQNDDPFGCVGSVKGNDAYVDVRDVTKITNLQFTNGATAKDVLETLMKIQYNAYWAIWESDHLWNEEKTPITAASDQSRFRFEWATWPDKWNYVASSADGMEQQLSAEDCFSQIFLRQVYETSDEPFVVYSDELGPWPTPGVTWDISETFEDQFDRAMWRDDTSNPLPTGTDSFNVAFTEGSQHSLPKNAGTITVRRAIHCRDEGRNSHHSTMGMQEPWELRPGKLILIRDIMPLADAGDLARGPIQLNPNSDFEAGTTSWTSEGGTFISATDQFHDGTKSGKITPTGAAANVAIITSTKYAVKPGQTYQHGAWVRNAVARNVWFRTRLYDASNALVNTIWNVFPIPANTWVYIVADVLIPAGATVTIDASVFMGGSDGTPPASNILWVDQFTLSRFAFLPVTHRNCVFRVAATEYNMSDNSCKMELDELPKWSLSTQIVNPSSAGISTR